MSEKSKVIGCLVLFALIGFGVMPAYGSLETSGTAYFDGVTTWRGSTSFEAPGNSNLKGTVYWAVFGPGDFPFTPDETVPYEPTPGELTYVYQIFNLGTDNITLFKTLMDNEADNIGWFSDLDNDVTGISPSSLELVPISAVWHFISPAIDQNGSSVGLIFSSTNTPMLSTSLIADGGTTAEAEVPIPSANLIPEPASMLVWLLGLVACIAPITVHRLWRR
jgi:hypothetical protein